MEHIQICIQGVVHGRTIRFLVTFLSYFPLIAHISVIEDLRLILNCRSSQNDEAEFTNGNRQCSNFALWALDALLSQLWKQF